MICMGLGLQELWIQGGAFLALPDCILLQQVLQVSLRMLGHELLVML